jgi:sugar phosphate isomerase/epimerase
MIDRRSFLKTAAGAGAALGLATRAPGAAAGMYVSLNSTLTGGKAPWPEFARLAAKAGYGGVDLNLGPAMKEGVDATRGLLSELKLRPAYCSLPVTLPRDEAAFRQGMAGLDEAARFASAVGCNRMVSVVPAGSQVPREELRKTMKERLTAAGGVLARHDVRLGLEFLGPMHLRGPHEFIWRMNEMLDLAKECGPNIGLLLDSWHWYHAGGTAEDILKAGKSRIVTVHVSDAARMAPDAVRDNQRLLPGEGVIDLAGFFQALQRIGYEDGVSPEPLGRIPKEMSAAEGARLGLESTLAVMKKAGVAVVR